MMQRRTFYIDVGDMSHAECREYLNRIRIELGGKPAPTGIREWL